MTEALDAARARLIAARQELENMENYLVLAREKFGRALAELHRLERQTWGTLR